MRNKLVLFLLIGLLTFGMTGMLNASPYIDNTIPIPDANILINFNNTGLDWVYAGPIATAEWGTGWIEAPSYRAGEGWRFATQAEWAIKPLWTDFIQPGYTTADVSPYGGWTDHDKYKFASEYWGQFPHVDLNDAKEGRVTNGLDIGSLTGVWETWYVRGNATPVPVPPSILLLAPGLLGLAGLKKKYLG
jgi:hypothetical protein